MQVRRTSSKYRGDDYHLLQPVYTLALINENFSKSEKFYHHYQIVNREDTDEVIPGLEFVLIELTDKFSPQTITDRKLMLLWLRFLKETNEKMSVLPDEMKQNAHISKAAELCKQAAFTPEELLKYEAYKEHIRIERAVREGTRRDALAEGEFKARKEMEGVITQKDQTITELTQDLAQKDQDLAQKNQTIDLLSARLAALEQQSHRKD